MDCDDCGSASQVINERKSDKNMEEVICKICLSIMIFPVTLPCSHEMCLKCYHKSLQLVSLLCPYCRSRISCWARTASKKDQIVNWKKWDSIKTNFPELVRIQLESNECNEDLDLDLVDYEPVSRVISSDGEIREEFEKLSQKEKERELAEEEATKQLIEKLLAEDQQLLAEAKQKLAKDTINDEEIALALQQQQKERTTLKTLRNRKYLINL